MQKVILQSPARDSKNREFLNLYVETWGEICRVIRQVATYRDSAEQKSPRLAGLIRTKKEILCISDWMAGAPGFEPGDGGIKI